MALDNSINTQEMGLPGLGCIAMGTFLGLLPVNFLPASLSGWLQGLSFFLACIYYIYSIYKKSKEK